MALIVETGSVVANAESYASVEFCDSYHAARGNTAWASLAEGDKEVRLRRATEFIDLICQGRWKGSVVSEDQSLAWPRYEAYDENDIYIEHTVIPLALKRATAEAALRAEDDLLPDLSSGTIAEEAVKVGPIEERIKYVGGKSQSTTYRKVMLLLKGLLNTGIGSFYLERS